MLRRILAYRPAHILLLIIIALGIIIGVQQELGNEAALILAVAPTLTWWLGQHFERAMILEEGLVDEEELKIAERNAASIYTWK